MEKYTLMGVAGEGQYGTVYRAQLKGSKNLVAIKKFKGQEDEATRREIDLLKQLNHPNIVTLRETFRVHGKLHIVFDYVPQDMLACLGSFPSGMPQPVVKSYIRQLCRALAVCHQKQIVHRDVKPENLLVAGKPGVIDHNETNLKLCDFGVARKISPSDARLTGYVSTRWYRAPELLNSAQLQPAQRGHGLVRRRVQAKWTRYTDMVDMWAVGCVMAELLTSRPLFPGSSAVDQLDLIRKYGGIGVGANPNGRSILRERLKTKICAKGFDFICKLLDMTPTNRLTANQAVAHPYMQDPVRQQTRVTRRAVGDDGDGIEEDIVEDIIGGTQRSHQHRPEDSEAEAAYHDDNFESDCISDVDEVAESVRSGAALASMAESKQHTSTTLAQSGIAVQKHQQPPPIASHKKAVVPPVIKTVKMPPIPVPTTSMSGGNSRRNSNNAPTPTGSPERSLPRLHAPAPLEIASARSKARRDEQSTHRSDYSHRSGRRQKSDASSNVGSHKSRQKPKRSERGRQRNREGGGRKEGRRRNRRHGQAKRDNSRLPSVARGNKPRRHKGRSGVSKGPRGGSKGPRKLRGRRHPHEEKQKQILHRRKGSIPSPKASDAPGRNNRFGPLPALAPLPKAGAMLEPIAGYERKIVVRKEGHGRRKKRGRKLRQRLR